MRKSSPQGFKLTTVIIAVLVMAVSAVLSNASVADDMDVEITQTKQ